ncbi:CPBP family intramembrane glutamic endopeptidase [Thalassotalea piscium]|uniref:Membrane protease YdiL (CAAX protease family) n=1 Tax=Thalassotalea piscium TaxID=1230533 RepID=A0A7X0NE16_9GAMM|nr:CPBP family intramembrane glutamic endopeptidase [Thalassotalea piscium]MBB6541611.1 membrane protease YdiL (CAAX protease family) [Thalassotalea piscium]
MISYKLGHSTRTVLLIWVFVIIVEVPIRMLIQPDPWLLHPTHWYFSQPTRVLIELTLVLILLLCINKYFRDLLTLDKRNLTLLIYSSVITVLLFSILEKNQISESINAPFTTIIIWLLTGFFVGVGQELVYRGILYTSLLSFISRYWAVGITTILFIVAPLHSVRLWNFYLQGELQIIVILVMIYAAVGVFFHWLRCKSDSIIVPSVAHGLGNGITWLAVFS